METPRARRRKAAPRPKKTVADTWILTVADAHLAAATATQMSEASRRLAARVNAGEDDALEVVRAAARARQAAEQCQNAETEEDACAAMRLAWAAVESAKEADQRLNAAIAESMTRPRQKESRQA